MEGPDECWSPAGQAGWEQEEGWKMMVCAEEFISSVMRAKSSWHCGCLHLLCWAICSVQVVRGGRRPRRPWIADPLDKKKPGDLWHTQVRDTWGHKEPMAPDLASYGFWGYKSSGSHLLRAPSQRPQLKQLISHLYIMPKLNYFKDQDVWNAAMRSLG